MFARNNIWPSLDRGDERVLRVTVMCDKKTGVLNARLAAHSFEIILPTLAVRRIGEHEVEFPRGEGVVGEGRVFRSPDDVVGGLALAL